ncbi:MAG: hypothetical protein M3Q29_11555 [Chloroflexota bacterium]|nr:hypothetical protein [Chloroflexota bacterium]
MHARYLRVAAHDGRLKATKVGSRTWLTTEEDVREFLEKTPETVQARNARQGWITRKAREEAPKDQADTSPN